ncbi:2,3-bisphosphoglycerate-independent phosphoglycerate mutase [Magnetococcales bacterium HHB-1]
MKRPKPMVLTILDGWGVRETPDANAIHHAKTPNFDRWWDHYPKTVLKTSGLAVGLPEGQMGNSEVGHVNLGAGRVVYQDYAKINKAVDAGDFARNQAITDTITDALKKERAIHIMALLSPGGIHSHTKHIVETIRVAAKMGAEKIYIHAFLDGRDTPPRSALEYIKDFEKNLQKIGQGEIVSVGGRYYGMDRDKRWNRVQKAYDAFTQGIGLHAPTARQAVEEAYARGENDEFVLPTLIHAPDKAPVLINDHDVVMMINFRADRMREICHALTDDIFDGFERQKQPKLTSFLCMTAYDNTLKDVRIAFPPESLENIFGKILSENNLTQLRAAETEKYAHVTYFFNGGEETIFPGEERLLIPSPKVATYDLKPEMSAEELTDALIEKIAEGDLDFIAVNFANPDMVGHTGIMDAAIKAIETVDRCLGRLFTAVEKAGGEMLITADHGNADQMMEPSTGQPHTAHTLNPVPFIYLGRDATLKEGSLCDVAPTLLQLMDLPKPQQMTGKSLVTLK